MKKLFNINVIASEHRERSNPYDVKSIPNGLLRRLRLLAMTDTAISVPSWFNLFSCSFVVK